MRRVDNSQRWSGRYPSDIILCRTWIVNICFVGEPNHRGDWVLIDAGTPFSSNLIFRKAAKLYGSGSKPKAIVLTHGHFDHVGALPGLLQKWDVPVYAHELELPYLTGEADYSRPDPTVGGGMMTLMSPLYPQKGINLGNRIRSLPSDNSIPGLPGWRWIHTPGHTNGHISIFRVSDRILISGDAFITVKQESLFAVLMQKVEPHGPPAYFTTDWEAAFSSVQTLRDLHPAVVFPGHGLSVDGEVLSQFLDKLTREFKQISVPKRGRYVTQ